MRKMNNIEGLIIILLGVLWIIFSVGDYKARKDKADSLEGYFLIKFIGGAVFFIVLGMLVFMGKVSLIELLRDMIK